MMTALIKLHFPMFLPLDATSADPVSLLFQLSLSLGISTYILSELN